MPRVLTSAGTVACIHGGVVTVVPGQSALIVAGAPAVLLTDLPGAVVLGCKASPKCTTVGAVTAGSSPLLGVAGTPVLLETAAGTTNAGNFLVQNPGQNTLDA